MTENSYCGYVAIIGRPNVGKSTLLNRIIGQKISITARKPQTTRHKILGIKTIKNSQAIYIDTPGLYRGKKKALHSYMKRAIDSALHDVDLVIFVIEALKWMEEDEWVLEKLQKTQRPIILVINKLDIVKNKNSLLPFIDDVAKKHQFSQLIPVSAKNGTNVSVLEENIGKLLPKSPFYYYEDQITDKNERFLVAEIIREKLTRLLGQEVPHELTVVIEKYSVEKKLVNIAAAIYVEKEGQKKIVIGKGGLKLKDVGTKARYDIERLIQAKVYLQLWVKVKSGWSSDEKNLGELGYK